MALGICDALRDAELLAEARRGRADGAPPLDEALAGYQRRRDEATLPGYRENLVAAAARAGRPSSGALVAALRGDQAAANHFFMAREGMVPRGDVLQPGEPAARDGRVAVAPPAQETPKGSLTGPQGAALASSHAHSSPRPRGPRARAPRRQARRVSNLRRRVVAGTLASFALAWGVIAFNGPMGAEATTHDDRVDPGTTAAATRPRTTTTTDDSTTDDSTSSDADDP